MTLYSTNDVQKLLACSKSTVRHYIYYAPEQERLVASQRFGPLLAFTREDLIDFLKRRITALEGRAMMDETEREDMWVRARSVRNQNVLNRTYQILEELEKGNEQS